MKGTIDHFKAGGRGCSLYLPQGYETGGHYPVAYLNGTDELPEIIELLEPSVGKDIKSFLVVNIDTVSWNDDMTPWPAPPLFNKSGPFTGRADAYLHALTNEIKPFVDSNYRTKPGHENTALLGYSLGGLTALYALYTCLAFGRIGCMSGSLWYENWLGYMETHKPLVAGAEVYISLGTKEQESKNPRMAAVGACTEKASEILQEQLSDNDRILFEWNDGGHFTEIPRRFCRALLHLMRT